MAGFVACNKVLVPQMDLWDAVKGETYRAVFHEDNESMIRVVQTGKNPTMKHMNRTHGV